uniref:Uncharacterized protein n=1 Tax=Cacopsylla melanoneura TaxID=428564 RepID=A0A8D8R2S9_9HEMI
MRVGPLMHDCHFVFLLERFNSGQADFVHINRIVRAEAHFFSEILVRQICPGQLENKILLIVQGHLLEVAECCWFRCCGGHLVLRVDGPWRLLQSSDESIQIHRHPIVEPGVSGPLFGQSPLSIVQR